MLEDAAALQRAVVAAGPDVVVHLAAQPGVRQSLADPRPYVDANLVGAFNLLEAVKTLEIRHLLIASTSSVYGANARLPFREIDRTDHPLAIYAATKKGMEDLAHAYAHLWKIPTTTLRLFTAYGPWGRPDMAPFRFLSAALTGNPIELYGRGEMRRDFTYIDGLVEAVARLIDQPPCERQPISDIDSLSPAAPYRVVNVGSGHPVDVLEFVEALERALAAPIQRRLLPTPRGEMESTWASPELLRQLTGYVPAAELEMGVRALVDWHRQRYGAR